LASITLNIAMSSPLPIDTLNARHAIPDIANIVIGNGGMPKIQITSPAASAEIYLHGAQITSWQPTGSSEVIFLSKHSRWDETHAIRGGIPICFPWFRAKSDDPHAPSHGFVRTASWQLDSLTQEGDAQEANVVATLTIEDDEVRRRWWPWPFRLTHRITVGAQLKLELTASNTGSSPFSFEEALHTYYQVGDAPEIRITGLDGVSYLDNRRNNREEAQPGDIILTQATDNAYLNSEHAVTVVDPVLQRRLHLDKQNSRTTIVWNPWQEGAIALSDLGDDEWHQMTCVEASNILSAAVTLPPGEQHTMTATLSAVNNPQA
jgi:glucose-6-phosphate 1-epimerase